MAAIRSSTGASASAQSGATSPLSTRPARALSPSDRLRQPVEERDQQRLAHGGGRHVEHGVDLGHPGRAARGRRRPTRPTRPDAASSPSKSSSASAAGSRASMNATTPGVDGDRAGGPRRRRRTRRARSRNSSTCASVAALTERWMVGGAPAYDICGWTYHPRASHLVADRERVAASSSVASATSVESGAHDDAQRRHARRCPPRSGRRPRTPRAASCEVARRRRALCTTAQAPASGPPDLVDCIVELSIV